MAPLTSPPRELLVDARHTVRLWTILSSAGFGLWAATHLAMLAGLPDVTLLTMGLFVAAALRRAWLVGWSAGWYQRGMREMRNHLLEHR